MAVEKKEITMQVPEAVSGFVHYFQTQHSAEGLDTGIWLRWGIVIILAIIIAFWHQHQNKAFHEYIRNKNKRTPISDRLSQLAYNRSFEILSLFFVLTLCVIFYDTRVNSLKNQLATATTEILAQQEEIAAQQAQLALKDTEIQDAVRLTVTTEEQQAQIDTLKQEFEGLFINYYLLKKCGLSTAQDFHIMNSALMYRLTSLNAPSAIRQSILDAASGSFEELYAEQECKKEELAITQENIRSYLSEVVENFPDR